MGATHALRWTRWPAYLDHARGKGLTFQTALCDVRPRRYTVSAADTQRPTTYTLSALSHCTLASVSLRESTQGSDSCGPQAHTTATANPRTPCLPTMQARRLRVPDSCDDYTTPSYLITKSLAE